MSRFSDTWSKNFEAESDSRSGKSESFSKYDSSLQDEPKTVGEIVSRNLTRQPEDIAVAAYFKAEKRGFEPGHEVEDWLEAEAELSDESEE